MAQIIQFRGGTALAWSTINPVLASREMGVETDTGQFKIGNGVSTWSALSYGGLVGPAQTNILMNFGDGSDGNMNITGVLNLTKSLNANNLTISGAGKVIANGYRILVKDTLDLSNAGPSAITADGNNGNNSVASTAAAAPTAQAAQVLGVGTAGTVGTSGTVATLGVVGTAPTVATPSNGGANGATGAAGNGSSANGGPAGAQVVPTLPMEIHRFTYDFIRGVSLIQGGVGGRGGSNGGGDGTLRAQQGPASGGNGGGVLGIWAKKIIRGAGTSPKAISAHGGDGATNTGTPAGNAGGSSGSSGAGGGWIALFYETLIGTPVTNLIDTSGGNGGSGANGAGTGTGGAGANGGSGGAIFAIKTLDGSSNVVLGVAGTAGSAASGTVGGNGGSGGACSLTL